MTQDWQRTFDRAEFEALFPRAAFDARYYLDENPDVASRGVDPWQHFCEQGLREGRLWTPKAKVLWPLLRSATDDNPTPLLAVLALAPEAQRLRLLTDPRPWRRLRIGTHPGLYAAQTGGEVRERADVIGHFLAEGIHRGLRSSILFNPEFYAAQVAARDDLEVEGHPFLHFLTEGWDHQVVPTPLFDLDHYRLVHKELRPERDWLFAHYWRHGAYEPHRSPRLGIVPEWLVGKPVSTPGAPVLLDCVLDGATPEQLRTTSPFEEAAHLASTRAERLETPVMRELVEKAAQIDPLVLRPYGPRRAMLAPRFHPATALHRAGEKVRAAIGNEPIENLVVIPHCRMGGSARVTGALTHALVDLMPDASTVVLTTDLPTFERADWFPPQARIVDMSAAVAPLSPDDRARVLYDVVRGLRPRRMINVNSKLGWEFYALFGKQAARITDLDAYLFTWDLDARGNKVGYPITAFMNAFSHLHRVFLDGTALRDELVWRYALGPGQADRLRLLHTPAEYAEQIDHTGVFERRRAEGGPLRAFWAGRFDRQKRFDVVVHLAELMPELEIWTWGKPVLGGLDVDFDDLPPNIRLQGTFSEFDELPIDELDFFLYTAEWDGIPTILIDVGSRGIATVASQVGSVGDVISDETGYPVPEALDALAYQKAILDMLADPAEVTRRTARLRARVRDQHGAAHYRDGLADALDLGGDAR